MSAIFDYLSSAASFVHLAVLCYIIGLLTRKELVLRSFLLLGTCFYILYYYFIAESPLWEAIAASCLIGAANMPVINRIFRERSTLGMSDEMLSLYKSFPNFNPGQFRKLMAQSRIVTADRDVVLLEHGSAPRKLYLTVSDGFTVERENLTAEIGPGNFLGEIAFLLGGAATATVIARPGCRYVEWEVTALHALTERSVPLANALAVLLNRDIAGKLAQSFPNRALPKRAV